MSTAAGAPATTRRHLLQPASGSGRIAEGGRRVRGLAKSSQEGAPLVSVITVCFKAAATLAQCIESVLRQTHPNVEHIIVDGASPDGTDALLKQYDDRVDYFVCEPDRGLYHAMNKGLALAQGDFILMLNADDWYDDTAIEQLLRAHRYAGTSFVSALAQAVDGQGKPVNVMRSMPYDDSARLRMPLRHETMLVPSAVYDAIGGYDESYRIIGDYELTVRLFEAGFTHYEIPRPLLHFRNTGVSNTDNSGVMRERRDLLARLFPFLAPQDLALLVDRDHHGGSELLAVARRHADQSALVRTLHAYVGDNARAGLAGRGRKQWRSGGQEMLAEIAAQRARVQPRVSVVLAVYDAEATLAACIDSVLAQTMADFELICVNDQTPDGSQALIDACCARDPRVRSLVNERNIGLGATRNRGIKASRGAYIFHIDPDDTIPPDALALLLKQAEAHGSDLVRGAYRREQFHHGNAGFQPEVMFPLTRRTPVVNARAADVPELIRMPEGHWAYLYRADLARRVPYPENLKMGQDALFLCSVLPVAEGITVVPDVVYHYLVNPASAMNVFNFRKYLDVLEWRRRAMHLLRDHGLDELGVRLVRTYAHLPWHDRFIAHFAAQGDRAQLAALGAALRTAHAEAGLREIDERAPAHRRAFLQCLLEGDEAGAVAALAAAHAAASSGTPAPAPAAVPAAAPATGPKVSVIVPYFKAEQTLRRCLDSVLAQTFADFEVVCVNDRSPDGSHAVVEEYRRRDARIVPVLNEVNIGHGASRNRGVAEARGEFIFHLDPDDALPPTALERIHASAVRYGSDMVKGAYMHEQQTFGQAIGKPTRRGLPEGAPPIVNTTLARSPDLLRTTEGHWSYLYRAEFARQVPYPTDLKMGQDSIFIVDALTRARSISVTPDVVYLYHANPDSAMNTFTFRKYMDALEWRRRAWHVLDKAGLREIGDRLLTAYWADAFFRNLALATPQPQLGEFLEAFRRAFDQAGARGPTSGGSAFLQRLFPLILSRQDDAAIAMMKESVPAAAAAPAPAPTAGTALPNGALRVATLLSRDQGGAATGSRRRVAALRQHGVDAKIHALVVTQPSQVVKRVPAGAIGVPDTDQNALWQEVRKRAILPATGTPGYRASELFSLHHAVVDFRKMKPVFDEADVVHLHWVVGMFDTESAGKVLADKPVVWTLADMNAFTGGCHYSEGCEEYRRECRRCPLLGGESDLAHETWKAKREAYRRIRTLHVICPSKWMAERARASSLFGDRPVHYIPNAFPTDKFQPTNKLVARSQLGLPLDRKLLLFGADSLDNRRKGGRDLVRAIELLAGQRNVRDVEVVVFGSSSIKLPVKVHAMGHITDEARLALVYSAADGFLFPSHEDNAPLTVGEALLCGTPVVANPVGNVPDIVEHRRTGYITAYKDAADFARGIAWVLDADHGAALARSLQCRLSAARTHDPQTAARRHVMAYQRAMANQTTEIA